MRFIILNLIIIIMMRWVHSPLTLKFVPVLLVTHRNNIGVTTLALDTTNRGRIIFEFRIAVLMRQKMAKVEKLLQPAGLGACQETSMHVRGAWPR